MTLTVRQRSKPKPALLRRAAFERFERRVGPQPRQRACRVGGQRALEERAQRLRPHAVRRRERDLVAAIEDGIGHEAAHGVAQHRFRNRLPAHQPFGGERIGEVGELRGEERHPRFDRERHRVAIAVAQQRGQHGLGQALHQRVVEEMPAGTQAAPGREGVLARKPLAVDPRRQQRPPDEAPGEPTQLRRDRGLEGLRDEPGAGAGEPHHRAHEPDRVGKAERGEQFAEPPREIGTVTREQLVGALAVEDHLDAVVARKPHHPVLRIHGETAERLALHGDQPIDVGDDLRGLDPHGVLVGARRPRRHLDERRLVDLGTGRDEAEGAQVRRTARRPRGRRR